MERRLIAPELDELDELWIDLGGEGRAERWQ
jgi:hypothetical protein